MPEAMKFPIIGEGPDIDIPETNSLTVTIEPQFTYDNHIYLSIISKKYGEGEIESELFTYLNYSQFKELVDGLCEYLYEYEEEHNVEASATSSHEGRKLLVPDEPLLELVWE